MHWVLSVHLVDQIDLFKISNLVYGGREIVLNVYSNLQGQRRTVYDGYSKLVGLPFVSVKIYGLRSFFWGGGNWHCKLRQFVFLGHSYIFCFARKDFMFVTLAHLRQTRKTLTRIYTGYNYGNNVT